MGSKRSVPNPEQQGEEFPFGANVEEQAAATPPPDPVPAADPPASSTGNAGNGEGRQAPLPPEAKPPANATGPAPSTNGAPAGPDPFDPAALRLSQNGMAALGVKKALLSVPVRKPEKSWFVRAHPAEDYRLQTYVIDLKEDRETYLVAQALWEDLATEATLRPKLLATAISRQGVLFLWPLNLPRPDGRTDEWTRTALEALDMATKGWVRVSPNMALGAYDVHTANASLPDPEWPQMPFRELLRIAFRDRYIDKPDHPVLRRLRGEV
jgi:hypothetical protein